MDFVELNEAGLYDLDKKRFDRSVNVYRYAIRRINEERTAKPRPLDARAGFYELFPIPLELDDDRPFTEMTASQDGRFVLYQTSFLIDYADIWFAYPFAITTILYNMALALHVGALERPDRVKLDQARQIYEKSLNYFLRTSHLLEDTRDGGLRILLFALCNNYGHCCSLLCDKDGMERVQQHLDVMLADTHSSTVLGPIDDAFFRMSLLMGTLQAKVSCSSPMA